MGDTYLGMEVEAELVTQQLVAMSSMADRSIHSPWTLGQEGEQAVLLGGGLASMPAPPAGLKARRGARAPRSILSNLAP